VAKLGVEVEIDHAAVVAALGIEVEVYVPGQDRNPTIPLSLLGRHGFWHVTARGMEMSMSQRNTTLSSLDRPLVLALDSRPQGEERVVPPPTPGQATGDIRDDYGKDGVFPVVGYTVNGLSAGHYTWAGKEWKLVTLGEAWGKATESIWGVALSPLTPTPLAFFGARDVGGEGVLLSLDGGLTAAEQGAKARTTAMSTMFYDKRNGCLYATTVHGDVLYVSADQGNTWVSLGSFLPGASTSPSSPHPDFYLDPHGTLHCCWWDISSDPVWSLWYSSTADWGATWGNSQGIFSCEVDSGGYAGDSAKAMVTSYGDSVFVVAGFLPTTYWPPVGGRVVWSRDGGATWDIGANLDYNPWNLLGVAVSSDKLHYFAMSTMEGANQVTELVANDVMNTSPVFPTYDYETGLWSGEMYIFNPEDVGLSGVLPNIAGCVCTRMWSSENANDRLALMLAYSYDEDPGNQHHYYLDWGNNGTLYQLPVGDDFVGNGYLMSAIPVMAGEADVVVQTPHPLHIMSRYQSLVPDARRTGLSITARHEIMSVLNRNRTMNANPHEGERR
jgi:hypothetical protein